MKLLRSLAQAAFLSAAILTSHAQSTNNPAILGQWDFNSPTNLAAATVGSPLNFQNFTPGYSVFQINGTNAGVLSLPALATGQRLLATFAPTNNGGTSRTNLNQYTIIMDVMYPTESDALWRGIFNADTNNANDSEIFVDPDGLIGNFNNYAGRITPTNWYRLVLTYDLATNQWARYLDGTNVLGAEAGPSALPLPEGELDGPFSLNGGVLFFSDNDGETAPVFVNVIQLRAGVLTAEEVRALGGPGSGGLGTGGEPLPGGDVMITGIVRNGSNLTITVDNSGRSIQPQHAPTLGPLPGGTPQWSNVGTPQTASTFTVPISGDLGFYRVQVLN